MPNSKDLLKQVASRITITESVDEIKSIASWLIESHYGLSHAQVMAGSNLNDLDPLAISLWIDRLNLGEPVQYITGEQYFYGRKFRVDSRVLIPRSETELLIDEIKNFVQKSNLLTPRILDLGTGSGCIPITCCLEINSAQAIAVDLSQGALDVAILNNRFYKTGVQFVQRDILTEDWPKSTFDVIVSNPPYITENEKVAMKKNVLNYEPPTALFVPDDNPLLFYKAIAAKGRKRLEKGGLLVLEVNEKYGQEVASLLDQNFYNEVKVKKDLSGKDRVVTGVRR